MIDPSLKHIISTVTNDLSTDQRMHRICSTLVEAGYRVTLVGREQVDSLPLSQKNFKQVRLRCRMNKGPMFYLEYNLRLRSFLLQAKPDLINPIDLDTLLAAKWAANTLRIPFVFDAHEYFTEVPELLGKTLKKKIWTWVGRGAIPKADAAYTVNASLAHILENKYGREFQVIRNLPLKSENKQEKIKEKRLIYQGVLNKGRCIEFYIDMMEELNPSISLHLYGDGDIAASLRDRAKQSKASSRIYFHGKLTPETLKLETSKAWLGLNLLESESLNYKYSLANKFFDYLNAGIPSLNSPLPEYEHIIDQNKIGWIVTKEGIVGLIHQLLNEPSKYKDVQETILKVKDQFTWENESRKLVDIYKKVLKTS